MYVSSSPISQGRMLGEIISNPPARMIKTVDGGNSWSNISGSLPDRITMDIELHPFNHDSLYIVLGGYGTSHIFLSTDGGRSWLDKGAGLPDVPFNTIAMDPENPLNLFAGCDLGAFVSYDGGDTWTDYSEGLEDATLVMDISISRVNRKLRMATHGKGVLQRALPPGSPSGIEGKFATAFEVYPNPVDNLIHIDLELAETETIELFLSGMDGKRIQHLQAMQPMRAGSHSLTFEIDEIPAGNYILELRSVSAVLSKKIPKR